MQQTAVFRPCADHGSQVIRQRAANLVSKWWQALRRWQRIRSTMRELGALEDRTLRDIGIDRSEIESVARTAAKDREPLRVFLEPRPF